MKVQCKQQWVLKVLGILITAIFLSCTGFFELEEEGIIDLADKNEQSTTSIYFNNLSNNYSVDIFSTPIRGDINKIATVSARYISVARPWVHTNEGYQFYLTYYFQIQGKSVQYIPQKYNLDYVIAAIPKNQSTQITIPVLTESIPNDVALFDETFLVIKNNFSSGIQFLNNNTILYPVGEETTLINNGTTALYKMNKGADVSMHNVLVQGVKRSLNEKILAFESGFLYEITVNTQGLIELDDSKLLTLISLLTITD
ncbi:MAG: hypothetical protein LBQ89_06645 [Treponema sp.]|nr:hypothetical protein [Treponema sp.]